MIVLEVIGCVLLIGGALFSIIGGIGIVRLPEFYSRMHGAGITDTMGAGLILIGLMFIAGPTLIAFKLFVILFFLTLTSPSSCHALARSALAHGLEPELEPDDPAGDPAGDPADDRTSANPTPVNNGIAES